MRKLEPLPFSRKDSRMEISPPGVSQPAWLPFHHGDKMPRQKPLKLFLLSPLNAVMAILNVLADALKTSTIPKKRGKRRALIRRCSKAVVWLLAAMRKHGDFGKCGITTDLRTGKVTVPSQAGSTSVGQPAQI